MAKGVRVDTWYYSHKSLRETGNTDEDGETRCIVEERKVPIEIRLLKETRETDGAPHETSKVSFEAVCKEFDIGISGTDIEAIRLAVWSALDKALRIEWSEFFLVEVERPYMHGAVGGSGVSISWRPVDKGTAWNGAELMREIDLHGRRGEMYRVTPWPGVFRQRGGRVMACIPATEANRAALEQFAAKMDRFREAVGRFLGPAHILKTLADLSTIALLSSSSEEHQDA